MDPNTDVVGGQLHLDGDHLQRRLLELGAPQELGGLRPQVVQCSRQALQSPVQTLGRIICGGYRKLRQHGLIQPCTARIAPVAVEQGVAQRDAEPCINLAGVGQVSCTLGGLQGELLQNVFGVFLGPEASPEETQMAGPALSKPEFHELVSVLGTGRRRDKADRSARCPGRGQYGGAIQAHLTSPALQHEGRIGPEMSAGMR
ncbi:MAG: hypothetical protein KKA37_15700 [Alphaproteobacteria bacterium]|nr:hypothetical protein [Alphaproteobacteria bacterium]